MLFLKRIEVRAVYENKKNDFEHFPFSIWYLNHDVVYPCHWFIIFLFYSLVVFGIDLYELNIILIVSYVDKHVFADLRIHS